MVDAVDALMLPLATLESEDGRKQTTECSSIVDPHSALWGLPKQLPVVSTRRSKLVIADLLSSYVVSNLQAASPCDATSKDTRWQ